MKTSRTFLIATTILLFAVALPRLSGQSKEATNDWAKADAAMASHLKQVDPNMRSAIFASALVRKYLPDFRIYVRVSDYQMQGETRIFLVNRRAEITPLPNEEWRKKDTEKFFRSAQVAEFIRRQKIKVQSAEQAVEVAKLFEEVRGAASYVSFLHINTKDFKVFDKAFLESQFGSGSNWKYSSEQSNAGWTVKVEYVGPQPVSIQQPPVYEIDLDEHRIFHDLRRF